MNNAKPNNIFDERERLRRENEQLRREYDRLSDQTKEIEKALLVTQRHKEELVDQLAATEEALAQVQRESAEIRREPDAARKVAIEGCAKIAEEQERERRGSAATAKRNGHADEAKGYELMATQAKEIAIRIRALTESPLSPAKQAVVDRALDRLEGIDAAQAGCEE